MAQDDAPVRPLEGVRVVDLTVNIAGPSATLILADLGAEVIKVEPPGGDVSRDWYPKDADGFSTVFSAFNRSKKSVVIDAKTTAGRELIYRLVNSADVFVESMRPGKADNLSLGWEDLRAVNESLIYCSVNAFGDVGPMAGTAGFDAVIQAYSGLMDLTGHPDGEPARVGGAVIDVGSGVWAALDVVAALMQRTRDGKGRHVQTTMIGTAIGFLMHHLTSTRLASVEPQRLGTAQHNFAPYQAIQAADRMVMVGVNSDAMWTRAAAALGVPHIAEHPHYRTNAARSDHRAELIAEIESATRQVPAEELVERLMAAAVPASVVRPVGALAADPQLEALGLWGKTSTGTPLLRTQAMDPRVDVGDVPRPGQDTLTVLSDLGLPADAIDELTTHGAIGVDTSSGSRGDAAADGRRGQTQDTKESA